MMSVSRVGCEKTDTCSHSTTCCSLLLMLSSMTSFVSFVDISMRLIHFSLSLKPDEWRMMFSVCFLGLPVIGPNSLVGHNARWPRWA